jgi:PhzF family phenazine biosynthesis protein
VIYYHADVFSAKSFSGNGLTVVFPEEDLEAPYMQKIAQEFKQFETIFLKEIEEKRFRARIFTVEEELDFAGHPILGAVSSIHHKHYFDDKSVKITFELNNKKVECESIKNGDSFAASMNQGVPAFLGTVEGEIKAELLQSLHLTAENLFASLPMEVVSTGLPYLIVPLASGLDQAKICVGNLEEQLSKVQAKFAYLLDVNQLEGRTWDNFGAVEDVATGSAAGPSGAYLCKRNICKATDEIIIHQGSFVGRPSEIKVSTDQATGEIKVAGDVNIIVKGQFLV